MLSTSSKHRSACIAGLHCSGTSFFHIALKQSRAVLERIDYVQSDLIADD